MTNKNKSLQEWVREDKLLLVEDASGKQTLYKESANTNDKLLLYVAEDAQQMKNYFRTRNIGKVPDVVKDSKQEATEEVMDNKLQETSMYQGGPDNSTTGNSAMDYRTYLAAELFGSPSFASQVPTADTHQEQAAIQQNQAQDGMGVLSSAGGPSSNMYEASISNQLIKLTKNLFRAGKINEAAKVADALEQPQNAAAFVLEAAIATDGSVDADLTEDLYQTAAILNNLQEG